MKCSDCTDLFFLFLFLLILFLVVFEGLWFVREEVPSLLLGTLAAKATQCLFSDLNNHHSARKGGGPCRIAGYLRP